MSEFSLIDKYCTNLGVSHADTKLSVGDDAAVITIPSGMDCAVSVDTMVEGVHFLPNVSPAALGHKILAVNLSDMAAMGATPRWATLALTMPVADRTWLKEFTHGLNDLARQHKVELVGGDTSQGPLTLSLQIMGLLPQDKALTRRGACVGDDIYVSNTLGDAALGLAVLQGHIVADVAQANIAFVTQALERPSPQCDLGVSLLGVANACIDLSDGLVGDLGHIAAQSQVAMRVDVESIPLSQAFKEFQKILSQRKSFIEYALSGGDDYQLAFTAAPEHRREVAELSKKLGITCTRIGDVIEHNGLSSRIELHRAGQPFKLKHALAYRHFSK